VVEVREKEAERHSWDPKVNTEHSWTLQVRFMRECMNTCCWCILA